jgi:hypothetical protein
MAITLMMEAVSTSEMSVNYQTPLSNIPEDSDLLVDSIWNKEELPHQWKESVVVPIHKKGFETDCNNYRLISLVRTTYKILPSILQ